MHKFVNKKTGHVLLSDSSNPFCDDSESDWRYEGEIIALQIDAVGKRHSTQIKRSTRYCQADKENDENKQAHYYVWKSKTSNKLWLGMTKDYFCSQNPNEYTFIGEITNEQIIEQCLKNQQDYSFISNPDRMCYTYMGSVNTKFNLPFNNVAIGDVYLILKTSSYVVWDGEAWTPLASTWSLQDYLSKIKFKTPEEHGYQYDSQEKNDPVNHPSHYTQGDVECIDAIEAALDDTQFIGYLRGQVMKYIWRMDHKNNRIEDAQKALWYNTRLIVKLKKKLNELEKEETHDYDYCSRC